MSTRSTIWLSPDLPRIFGHDRSIHVYRDIDRKVYIEIGRPYSDWTFEWPRLWRRGGMHGGRRARADIRP